MAVTSAFAVVLACGVASADEKSDAARAAALFEEGRRLLVAEDYAAACPKLAESQALSPAPDTASDLGLCYESIDSVVDLEQCELSASTGGAGGAGGAGQDGQAGGPLRPGVPGTRRTRGATLA